MSHQSLHIHAYTGRESGIMIIGTKDELGQFAVDLQQSLEIEPKSTTPGWPYEVLVVSGESPFSERDYPISFHVRTEPLTAELKKRPRYGPSAPVFIGIAFLALVGLVSLPMWAAKLF